MNALMNKNSVSAGATGTKLRAFSANVTRNLLVKPYYATKDFMVSFKVHLPFAGIFKEEKALSMQAKELGLPGIKLVSHSMGKMVARFEIAFFGAVGGIVGASVSTISIILHGPSFLHNLVPTAIGLGLGAIVGIVTLPARLRKNNAELAAEISKKA